MLVSVAERYPCVVVSGRRLDDLTPRLEVIPLRMSAPPESLLAILVGKTGGTRARFHLERQAEIHALLRVLLALRSEA